MIYQTLGHRIGHWLRARMAPFAFATIGGLLTAWALFLGQQRWDDLELQIRVSDSAPQLSIEDVDLLAPLGGVQISLSNATRLLEGSEGRNVRFRRIVIENPKFSSRDAEDVELVVRSDGGGMYLPIISTWPERTSRPHAAEQWGATSSSPLTNVDIAAELRNRADKRRNMLRQKLIPEGDVRRSEADGTQPDLQDLQKIDQSRIRYRALVEEFIDISLKLPVGEPQGEATRCLQEVRSEGNYSDNRDSNVDGIEALDSPTRRTLTIDRIAPGEAYTCFVAFDGVSPAKLGQFRLKVSAKGGWSTADVQVGDTTASGEHRDVGLWGPYLFSPSLLPFGIVIVLLLVILSRT